MRVSFFVALLMSVLGVVAQPAERLYHVAVYPSDGSWNFEPGQKVRFDVRLTRCDVPVGDVEAKYELSEDMMSPFKSGTVKLKNGVASIDAGTMKKPGFMRCKVTLKQDGREYTGMGTVGFAPEKLQPVTQQPSDFHEFWDKAIADARKWNLEPVMTLIPEKCTPKVNVYHVSWANSGWESRMYGILTVPAAPGKYPAVLKLPGAGVRGYNGDIGQTEKGVMILEVGIHGIPFNLQSEVYTKWYNGALNG
ncbi:MAG: acetylxylan esterase, partial [Muribaculaceae bacterium]|nr:acetylxylan esterase [Muribaculaceae bacterium]